MTEEIEVQLYLPYRWVLIGVFYLKVNTDI